jgi:hypothetical protein
MGGQYENGSKGNRLDECGLNSYGSGYRALAGCCEYGDELSGFL